MGLTLLESLKSSGQISDMIFSFYFDSFNKGTLLLGAYTQRHYIGELYWIPTIAGRHLWEIPMAALHVASQRYNLSDHGAIVDTGSSVIMCPEKFLDKLVAVLDAYPAKGLVNSYEINCGSVDQLPTVYFVLGNRRFGLKPEDYIIEDFGNRCILSFHSFMSSGIGRTTWILGFPFLQAYYSVYDAENGQIGLAKAFKRTTAKENKRGWQIRAMHEQNK